MKIRKPRRDPALDVIRCVALFCLAGLHFFLNSEFYDRPAVGPRMFIMSVMCVACSVCVPLFLLLSGYLLHDRKPTKSYYKKLIKTLCIYVLCSLCCIAYKLIYAAVTKEGTVSLFGQLTKILSYTAAPYGWYIEMYIGLFLLIPFLNILYQNLNGKKQKQGLLLTLLFLTALPQVTNVFRFDLGWWLSPGSSTAYHHLVPEWWVSLFPVTYYFLGCYLQEFPQTLRPRYCALGFVLLCVLDGAFTYYRSDGQPLVEGRWLEWGSLLNVALSVLVFRFFTGLSYKNLPKAAATVLARISDLSLGAFLVSWIFDRVFYRLLNSHVPVMPKRLEYFPIMVFGVLFCSLILSGVIHGLYDFAANKLSKKT